MKAPTHRTLGDDLRDYYRAQKLSPAARERLMGMAEAVDREGGGRGRRTRALGGWLAAAVLTAALGLWLVGSGGEPDGGARLARAVAEEIAMNHSKDLAVEFDAGSLGELRRRMEKLDFTLVDTERLTGHGLRLVGARYCSIQGHLAAQIRLAAPDGESATLYETAAVEELAGLSDQELRADEVRVEIWREGDVLMGLARSP